MFLDKLSLNDPKCGMIAFFPLSVILALVSDIESMPIDDVGNCTSETPTLEVKGD